MSSFRSFFAICFEASMLLARIFSYRIVAAESRFRFMLDTIEVVIAAKELLIRESCCIRLKSCLIDSFLPCALPEKQTQQTMIGIKRNFRMIGVLGGACN